jgi:acylphosphatase
MTMQADITVTGRVQGIFMRAEARQKALELGLAGWVRNENDGSVTICAQGQREELEKFADWCRIGPQGARVDSLKVDYNKNPSKMLKGFEIVF